MITANRFVPGRALQGASTYSGGQRKKCILTCQVFVSQLGSTSLPGRSASKSTARSCTATASRKRLFFMQAFVFGSSGRGRRRGSLHALSQLPGPHLGACAFRSRRMPAMSVVTIGLDLAKSGFQVHGVDAGAHTVLRRRLGRTDLLPFFAKQAPCIWRWRRARTSPFGAGAGAARASRPAYFAAVREALRQAQQDRCGRCGGHLRGGTQTEHALRADKERRATRYYCPHRVRALLVRQRSSAVNAMGGLLGSSV
jgi:hypothetical protein